MEKAKYYNESRKNSTIKHMRAHYHRIPLSVKNEYYDNVLKPAADRAGESVNGYIKKAIAERIEREGGTDRAQDAPDREPGTMQL